MKKKNEENRHAESLEQSLKALFGEEGDLTDAELDEELDACGIDAVELQANVHRQLIDYSNHHYRTLDRDVPANLEKTLRALRPPSASEKAKAIVRTAENLVGSFLDTAKTKSSELLSTARQTRQPQFAFRNKKELSAADKDLLQSEQEDVDSSDES